MMNARRDRPGKKRERLLLPDSRKAELIQATSNIRGCIVFDRATLYLPRGVVADIHVEVLVDRTLATGAMAHPAPDQMRRRPRYLRVMADLDELVRRIGPVLEVLVFHVPHSDGEVPATYRRDSKDDTPRAIRSAMSANPSLPSNYDDESALRPIYPDLPRKSPRVDELADFLC